MINFNEYKTVPMTFELEQTIAENESYKSDNKFLIGLTLVVVIGAVGMVMYFIREQRLIDERYKSRDEIKLLF